MKANDRQHISVSLQLSIERKWTALRRRRKETTYHQHFLIPSKANWAPNNAILYTYYNLSNVLYLFQLQSNLAESPCERGIGWKETFPLWYVADLVFCCASPDTHHNVHFECLSELNIRSSAFVNIFKLLGSTLQSASSLSLFSSLYCCLSANNLMYLALGQLVQRRPKNVFPLYFCF